MAAPVTEPTKDEMKILLKQQPPNNKLWNKKVFDDVEIKLDEDGCVLPASHVEEVYKRIAVCIDGPKRFAANASHLLGKEAIKQRHLKILGYEVVQIPYYEFENLKDKVNTVEYLHKKIFPHTYRLSW